MKSDLTDFYKGKIKKLHNEFEEWVQKVNEKWSKHKRYSPIPSRLNDLIFRNRCRSLFDSNQMMWTNNWKASKRLRKRYHPPMTMFKTTQYIEGSLRITVTTRNFK
eukprot:469787_1